MSRLPASGLEYWARAGGVLLGWCLAAGLGCAGRAAPLPPAPVASATAGEDLVIGEFALANDAVIDGDTIRVTGLERSLRLVGFDAEETFKNEADRVAATDWPTYVAAKTASSPKPVKFATPAGEAAKAFAKEFFHGVGRVRLERDHPRQTLDVYDRLLAYVFVERDGVWLNYNLECVRAGWAPYFMKYGYSLRFHDLFEAAMHEARTAGRGIWSDAVQHYPDYDRRLVWWRARAEIVRTFMATAENEPRYILLSDGDALERLRANLGQEVSLLGGVGSIVSDRLPVRVYLNRRRGEDVPLIFHSRELFAGLGLETQGGEYIQVRGAPSIYRHPRTGKEQLQIVVEHPRQVTTFAAWPPPD